MALNRRQFLGASALVGGAIVMTPFGRAMAAPMTLPADVVPPTPITVSGADGVLDSALANLPPFDGYNAQTVIITPGTYKRFRPIIMPSNVYLNAGGSTFILQTKGKDDALLRIENATNVTINGGTWDGNKKIVKAKTEWRHSIRVHNSSVVTLQHLRTQNAKGDGIYLGLDSTPCTDVKIDDVTSTMNVRSGLAVTACDGLKVTNSKFYSNSGEAPEAGVVIEPHNPSVINNILFDNCQFYSNASRGLLVVMKEIHPMLEPGIAVNNCTFRDNGKSTKDQSTAGIALLRPRKVTITSCRMYGNQNGVFILGRRPGDHSTVYGDVTLDNCSVTSNRKDGVIVQNSITSLQVLNSRIVNNSRKKKNTYDGLRIKQGNKVQVTKSTVSGHRYGVYADKHVGPVYLTNSILTGNKKGRYYAKGASVIVN